MDKRDRVIKAFEFCLMPPSREELENDICSHEDCPYYREYNGGKCVSAAAADSLALLKAQEPVEPKKVKRYIDFDGEGQPYTPETYDCGACGKELPWKANYCPECGKAVKWE